MRTILVASDAPSVRREVAAVTDGPRHRGARGGVGPEVFGTVPTGRGPDLVVVDMQMGNMGGMAVCLELRLEESYLDVDHVPVLMLLDRRPDVFLARRSGAEGWLVKPLDPLRLRRATAGPAGRRDLRRRLLPAGAGAGRALARHDRCAEAPEPEARPMAARREPDPPPAQRPHRWPWPGASRRPSPGRAGHAGLRRRASRSG